MQVQNTYTPINFEGKVKFKRASLFDGKKLCTFDVDHENLGKITIKTERVQKGRYAIRVGTQNNSRMTNETFCMSDDDIYGVSIKTNENYRRQHLGELSRLASVITMLKNGLKEINILSIDDAVLYHSKYKFEPNIESQQSAILILKHITSSNSEVFAAKAKKIIADFRKTDDTETLYKATNKLVSEYIEEMKTQQSKTSKPFTYWGLDMRLTRENVIKNRDFFNSLLEKHDIDYKI